MTLFSNGLVMRDDDAIILFHAPQSRSTGARILLEELGAPYILEILNIKAGEQRRPAYLSINPLGKVPAILHHGVLTTEQVAIFIYLADLFPKSGLAPAVTDPQRGAYLRWMVFYAACYEPGLVDTALKREPAPLAMSPYGSFDVVLETLFSELAQKPYLLGDRISAADILWGHALRWGDKFGLLPKKDFISEYIARVCERPIAVKVAEQDSKLADEHAKVSA